MTVYTIETVFDVIVEMQEHHINIGSVWEYTNAGNNKKMFAIFTVSQCCDIHDNPYVNNPKLIWTEGKFINDYSYLNENESP